MPPVTCGPAFIKNSLTIKKQYDRYHDSTKLVALYKRVGDEFTVNMIKQYILDTVIYIDRPCKPEFIVRLDGYEHGFSIAGVDSFKYVHCQELYGPLNRCTKFRCRVILKNKKDEDYVDWKVFKIKTVLDDMIASCELRTYNECRYVPFSGKQPSIGKKIFNIIILE